MTAKVQRLLRPHTFLQFIPALSVVLTCLWCGESTALDARKYSVEVSVEVQSGPFALKLEWTPSDIARTYTIRRRLFGSTVWGGVRASLPGSATGFVDTLVSEGTAYEYEVQLETTTRGDGGWVNAFGYVLAGSKVTWPDLKGKVLLIVESTAAASLNEEINSFQRNLIGAGWFPIRRDLPQSSTVPEVKNLIRAEYNADPSNVRAVILLGHVPVPYSGNIAPDLHPSHRGAWPADVHYADIDGTWTDNTVNITSGDYRANDNWPGDGKFDQSQIPSTVELELGRIDFYDLPAFGDRTQLDLLRTYLQKNSDFRHRKFTMNRRMLVRDNFGDLSGDAPAVDAWRHYRQMFGAGNVREVGPGGFFPTLQNESFLWAYGCGGGGNTKADEVGTTTDFAELNPRAVFFVLHGSYFGDWNTKDNFLRAAIGGPNYSLASIWSGLPHWFMHPMALGRSVGHVTRLTQNNVDDYKSHLNISAQQVHIALIGDPTLENHPVIAPSNLSGSANGKVTLNWSASADENIIGYQVYYSGSSLGPYQRLTSAPIGSTSYAHAVGNGTHHYMVRAVKLERTGSGSFYNLSQGTFVAVTVDDGVNLPPTAVGASVETVENTAISISLEGEDPEGLALLYAIKVAPANGTISGTPPSVIYTPDPDYFGMDAFTFAVSDGKSESAEATVSINVKPRNKPPVATPDSVVVMEDEPFEIALSGIDPDNDILETHILLYPTNGILTKVARGLYTYTPQNNFNGTDRLTFEVRDAEFASEAAAVDITVVGANDPPVAFSATMEIVEDQIAFVILTGWDVESDPLEYHLVSGPTNGVITGESWNLVYRPATNYFGPDALSFVVTDGSATSQVATVAFRIAAINDAPVAKPLSLAVEEDGVLEIRLEAADAEDDDLTFQIETMPLHGMIAGNPPNLLYTPDSDFNGVDTFTYMANDGASNSAPASVLIQARPVNDPPSIGVIGDHIHAKNSAIGPIELSVVDIDDVIASLSFWAESSNPALIPTNRIYFISGNTNRQMTLAPIENGSGEAEIVVHVSDGEATAETSFVLTITNAVPVVNDDDLTLPIGTSAIAVSTLLANDFDPDRDALRVVSVSPSELGREVQLTNSTVIYFGGTNALADSFVYEVEDTSAVRRAATVHLRLFSDARISSVFVQSGNVRLLVAGAPNRTFTVLRSADWKNWEAVGQGIVDENGRGEFVDSGGAHSHHRLYRIEWLEN